MNRFLQFFSVRPGSELKLHAACRAILCVLSFLIPLQALASGVLPKEIRFGQGASTNYKSSGGKPTSTDLSSLAEHLGYFEQEFGKNGPKITQVFFSGYGPAQNEALAQGVIDFGSYGGVPNVVGLAGGVPAHIVIARRSSGAGSYYIAVHQDSPIKTIADLRGKRIAVFKGTNPYLFLVKLLESKGIAEKEVKLVNLQGNEALVAFNAGAVDAVFGNLNLLILRDKGKVRLVPGTKDFRLDPSQSALLVSSKFEREYPEVLKRVVKVLLKTSWWASQEANREALLKFISERTLGYQYVAENYAGSLKDRYNPLIDESSVAAFKTIVQFSFEHKVIRKVTDETTIRNWFRPQYQQAALKELKLQNFWTETGGHFKPAPLR